MSPLCRPSRVLVLIKNFVLIYSELSVWFKIISVEIYIYSLSSGGWESLEVEQWQLNFGHQQLAWTLCNTLCIAVYRCSVVLSLLQFCNINSCSGISIMRTIVFEHYTYEFIILPNYMLVFITIRTINFNHCFWIINIQLAQ